MKILNTRIVMVLLSLIIASASYADTPILINGLYYNLDSDKYEAQVTGNGYFNGVRKYGKESIVVPSEITYNQKTYKVTSIERGTFLGETALTSISIPNSVLFIGEETFEDCTNLTSVTLPNSLTSIERGTFLSCSSLKSINIPNSVKNIYDDAFMGCNALYSVTIPNSVTTIGECAFKDCEALTSIVIPNSVDFISTHAFENCKSLKSITVESTTPIDLFSNTFAIYGDLHVPAGSKAAYKNAAIWKKFNIIEEGEATGISNLNANNSSQNIYSLSGTHLYAPRKGVNIINGKKVVIK